VEAVVDTSAHTVIDAAGAVRPRGASSGEPMVFALRWGEGRWRVASVEEVGVRRSSP
jgi:hypothetical protein